MRILNYNFVQPEEAGAGGVGVYLKNLVDALTRDHEVITLSAGDLYSPKRTEPWIDWRHDGHQRAVIVNSPMTAPAGYAFADVDTYTYSHELDFVPAMLLAEYGAIDVFHFHNIEGLTRSFFYKLRQVFPHARMLYSAHNYNPLCARVSLWYQDRAVCVDYREGQACTQCRAPVFDRAYIRNRRRLIWAEKKHPRVMKAIGPLVAFAKLLRRKALAWRGRGQPTLDSAGNARPPAPADSYAAFRRGNIAMFADVFDRVLTVSDRTREVLAARGVPPTIMTVSYIGTSFKPTFLASTKISDIGEGVHLGYLGYMFREKGFPFLIECLERLPDEVAAGLSVTIAAKAILADAPARMERLATRYRTFRYFDGYTHENFPHILDGVNLGVVPVLWEDNLPQTAIELVARGIPTLTSDRGGAQEVACNPSFTFTAGSHDDFIDLVCRIARRDLPLAAFWNGRARIISMDEHLEDLMHHYRAPVSATVVAQEA